MTDLSGLISDPREFLKYNLLIMDTSANGVCPFMVQAVGMFRIKPDDRFDNVIRKSKRFWKSSYGIKALKVSWAHMDSGSDTLAGFWLPYEADNTKTATLPSAGRSDARLMFTAPLSGCTFASATYKNGTAKVAHANYQTEEGTIDHGRIQQNTNGFTNYTHRDSYRTRKHGRAVSPMQQAGLLMTVVGVNLPQKGWKFYGQQFELDMMTCQVEYIKLHYLN
ncbi:hypothetical protein [Fodinicurvata sp. EGI_FJ10296]|uniref:hypothetical protein n=1 Tax=Fodinicurvata sp. EGI_FJ10296 TaxID=3231908 RepID=UPI0034559854